MKIAMLRNTRRPRRSRNRLLLLGAVALVLLIALGVGAGLLVNHLRGSGDSTSPGESPPPAASVSPDDTADPEQGGSAEPDPDESAKPTKTPGLARIRVAGDVIIEKPMLEAAYKSGNYRFNRYFTLIRDQLADADYTLINVEGSLGGSGKVGYTGYPSYNTPPSILDTLKSAGVDMLTMANNHILDRYFDGLQLGVRNVDRAGLKRIGAYKSKADYNSPRVITINDIKVGFTAYTTSLNGMDSKSDSKAIAYGVRTTSHSDFEKDMLALREQGAQMIVVYMHWDREMKRKPSETTRSLAKKLTAAGADVIVGSNPHVVQPLEYVTATDKDGNERQALCMFSVGNFLSNQKGEYVDNGIIFEFSFKLDDDGSVTLVDPKYLPVGMWVHKVDGVNNYQALPIGATIDNPPEGMSAETVARFQKMWEESYGVLGEEIAKPLRQ